MSATRALARSALVALALTVAPALTPALHAQSAQRLSVQASGILVSAFGEAYEGLKAGPGGELQLRYTPGVWSFGVGGQISNHDIEEDGFGDESVRLAGVFFEPRRVIDVGNARFAPYASGRLAFLRQSLDLDLQGETLTATASGVQVNVGGGVLLRASPRVNIDLGATFGVINFGDAEVTVPGFGTVNAGSTGSGQNLVLRAGVAIGL